MIEVRRACSRSGRRVSSVIGPSSRRQHGALEEDEAARVEAGEIVEALLREQQKRVQPLGGERLARCNDAALELRTLEVQRHGPSLPAGAASLFICRAVRKLRATVMP